MVCMSRERLVKVYLVTQTHPYYDFDMLRTWTRFMLQNIQSVFDSNFIVPCFILLGLLKYVLSGS